MTILQREKRRAAFWLLATLVGGLLAWTIYSWPIPRSFGNGIAASHWTDEKRTDRELIPGDHIQLLYHFWLARDMLAGGTPAFADVYEFNADSTDRDAEIARARRIDPYYAPFSWVYAAVSPFFGDAAGWNSAALFSVVLGALGLFLLACRHTVSKGSAFLAALAASAFPYRWIALHAGSPTGFAMGLAPFVPLGLDIAVRDKRVCGGLVAGAALFLAYCSDLHVFYFSAIAAPAWCLFSLLCAPGDADAANARPAPRSTARETARVPLRAAIAAALPQWRATFARIALALLPAVLLALAAALAGSVLNRGFAGTDMAGGRTWNEVKMFSPRPDGLFDRSALGMSCHLFLTLSLPALFALCLGYALANRADARANSRNPRIGFFWTLALLFAAMTGIVLLALGSNCPGGALPMQLARRLIPRYDMIRQSVKIYCLMPSLVSVALALLLPRRRQHPGIHVLAMLLIAMYMVEVRAAMRPSISLLPTEQPVYETVAADAAGRGATAHALAIPLWPGDSHWSSVYLYGVMHSRVRLVNGYSPAKRDDYVENVFRYYESMNEGIASDEQLDRLLASGVGYVILHEDAFPEKVSPYPASTTLRLFAENPRLELAAHDGTVWAFRIHTAGALAADTEVRPPDSEPPRPSPDAGGRGSVRAASLTLWPQTVESISTVNWKARAMDALPPLEPNDGNGGFRIAVADLFHAGETVATNGAVRLVPSRDPAGAIVYGPNRALPTGDYSVKLSFSSDAPAGTVLGYYSILTTAGETLASATVTAGETVTYMHMEQGRRAPMQVSFKDGIPIRFEFYYAREYPVWSIIGIGGTASGSARNSTVELKEITITPISRR